jgi:hypothetical protein
MKISRCDSSLCAIPGTRRTAARLPTRLPPRLAEQQGPALSIHNASDLLVHNPEAKGGSKPTFQISGSRTRSVRLQGLSGQADDVEIGTEVPQPGVKLE